MASSSQETPDLSSGSETTLSHVPVDAVPPAVIDAEDEEIVSAVPITVNIQDPKIMGAEPLDVAPLRMVPFGGKEPVPFSEHELARLREQELDRLRGQEAPIPLWLESLPSYNKGDWKAYFHTRSDGRKDWTYAHREYRKKFRSAPEVEEFLKSKGTTDMFKGRKLQRKKLIDGPDGQGAGTSKPTRGRKAENSTREKKILIDPSRPVRPDIPPGFL